MIAYHLCKGLLAKVDVDAKLQQVKTQTFSEFKIEFYFPRLLQFYTAYKVKGKIRRSLRGRSKHLQSAKCFKLFVI